MSNIYAIYFYNNETNYYDYMVSEFINENEVQKWISDIIEDIGDIHYEIYLLKNSSLPLEVLQDKFTHDMTNFILNYTIKKI